MGLVHSWYPCSYEDWNKPNLPFGTAGIQSCKGGHNETPPCKVGLILYLLIVFIFRYLIVVSGQMSSRGLVMLMISIWTFSSVLACPSLLFSTTETYHGDDNNTATACIMVWPDGPQSTSFMDHIYQVILLLFTYILPLLGLSITYTYLSRVLWKLQWQSSFFGNRDIGSRAKKEMRKVAKMFIVILIIFGVCWLPYNVYFMVLFYYPVSN